MALKIVEPWKVTDAELYGTNVAEDPYAFWSNVTTYSVGDYTIFDPTHTIYYCTLGHSNKTPNDPANIGVYWVLVGKTRRWRAFDYSSANNPFSSVQVLGAILYRVKPPTKTDTVAFLTTNGSFCAVDVIRNENALAGGTGTQRNLLPYSEEQEQSNWLKNNVIVTQDIISDPWEVGATVMATGFGNVLDEGTANGLHYIQSPSMAIATATQYTFSIFFKRKTGGRRLMLALNPAFFSASPKAFFTPGNVVTTSGGATATITATNGDWYRCTITATSTSAGAGWGLRVHITDGATESYIGTNASGYAVCGAMCNTGATASSYQWTRELPGGAASVYGSRVFRQMKAVSDTGYIEDGGGPVNDAIFTGVGALTNDVIGVTVYPGAASGYSECSEIVFGATKLLGDLLTPLSGSVLDFSRKDRNEFGTVTLIPRTRADQQSYTFLHDFSKRQYIKRVIRNISGRTVLFYEDTDLSNEEGLLTFGFWTEYNDDVSAAPVVMASITVESMS
jgi:hypothetical protein